MKEQDNFDLDYQFERYMSASQLDQQGVPKRLVRELKRAFFASAGQMLAVMRDDLFGMEEDKAIEKLKGIEDQAINFFYSEAVHDKQFEDELKRRANLN